MRRRRAVAWVAGLPSAAALVALAVAPRCDVETSVDVAASPEQVWAVLTDTQDYPAWNSDMRLVGVLRAGQVIEHDEGQGNDRMVFHPLVLEARPGRALRWFGRLWFWHVLDAEHFFQIAPRGAGSRVTQGERLHGVALWLFDGGSLLPRFMAMDLALKARAEAHLP